MVLTYSIKANKNHYFKFISWIKIILIQIIYEDFLMYIKISVPYSDLQIYFRIRFENLFLKVRVCLNSNLTPFCYKK